jgi:hypothetical protein
VVIEEEEEELVDENAEDNMPISQLVELELKRQQQKQKR